MDGWAGFGNLYGAATFVNGYPGRLGCSWTYSSSDTTFESLTFGLRSSGFLGRFTGRHAEAVIKARWLVPRPGRVAFAVCTSDRTQLMCFVLGA